MAKRSELPPGLRLVALINGHLDEIMARERGNTGHAHLYCTGPYWVAFERSAFQLLRAIPDSEVMPMRLLSYPLLVVTATVSDSSLRRYSRKRIIELDNTEFVTIKLPTYTEPAYNEWHAREVEGLPRL